MSPPTRYSVAVGFAAIISGFDLEPAPILRAAGLPSDFLSDGARPVTAQEYYATWRALETQPLPDDFPKLLAERFMAKKFDSSIYSFFSSPTVRVGLQRKSLLVPLIMPVEMSLIDTEETCALTLNAVLPETPLPRLLVGFEMAFFVAAIREATGAHVTPTRITSPTNLWSGAQDFLGCTITHSPQTRIDFSVEDAARPMISRSDPQWDQLEKGLAEKFAQTPATQTTAHRVRHALIEGLPGGQVTIDQIARALAVSSRSLQRRLRDEQITFKDILADTRRAMALNYLSNSDLSVQEIAYLLGFRDPTSFFRAFRSWTGQTPQSLRD